MLRVLVHAVILVVALAASIAGTRAASASPAIDILLAPRADVRAPDAVATLALTLRFSGVTAQAGRPFLEIPLISNNVDTVATVIDDLDARDDDGPLVLQAVDVDLPVQAARDAAAGGASRQWIAARASRGPVTVRYSVPAHAVAPPRGPAPPIGLSDDGGGVSVAGHVILLLPTDVRRFEASVAWDLSAAPAGARGVSSLGEGDVRSAVPMSDAELRMTYFMAGAIGTWPDTPSSDGFFAAWQGQPAFDARMIMAWTGALYKRYRDVFKPTDTTPYGVFLRYNPVNAGGGVGLHRSFVTTFGAGAGADPFEVKSTLAHEMFHTFQPYIETPPGLVSSWFGEGLAVFYAARLPLRFGMFSPEEFLRSVNFAAGRYYTSAMAETPNAEVPRRFWADTRIRTLPYDRGMLYFATVDHALRTASGGTRSLDDLMLAMLARQRAGATLANADWEALLRQALGESAVTDFRAFLDGRIPVPASDAFGPCFRRITVPLRRYEVGFDPAVLAEPRRIVRGLVEGTNAAAAGLRNGDEIVKPVPQDSIQGHQDEELTLRIRRGSRVFDLSYLPRGDVVEAYQWQRVAGVPDSACAL